jgi:hypothetical protein
LNSKATVLLGLVARSMQVSMANKNCYLFCLMMDGVIYLDDADDDEDVNVNVNERTEKGIEFLAFESHCLPAPSNRHA